MLLAFFELGAGKKMMLIETDRAGFQHETYGICVGTPSDWKCCGFFEVVSEA